MRRDGDEVEGSASATSWRLPKAPRFVAEQFPPNVCRTRPRCRVYTRTDHLTVWSRIEGTVSLSACIGGLYERARARVHGAWHCLWRSHQRLCGATTASLSPQSECSGRPRRGRRARRHCETPAAAERSSSPACRSPSHILATSG